MEEEHSLKRKQKPKIMKKNSWHCLPKSMLKLSEDAEQRLAEVLGPRCWTLLSMAVPQTFILYPKGVCGGARPLPGLGDVAAEPPWLWAPEPWGPLWEPAPAPSVLGWQWHRAPSHVHGAWQQSGDCSRQHSQSPKQIQHLGSIWMAAGTYSPHGSQCSASVTEPWVTRGWDGWQGGVTRYAGSTCLHPGSQTLGFGLFRQDQLQVSAWKLH